MKVGGCPLETEIFRSADRECQTFSAMESLILAQNERWRHGLGMQVERDALGRLVAKG